MDNIILVESVNGQALTSSLKVAEYFGKDHKNILRDIRSLLDTGEVDQLNFELCEIYNPNREGIGFNKTDKVYNLTKDGFTLLAMGFTGSKALKFKLAYIKAFNEMESNLKQVSIASYQIDNPVERAEKWILEQKEVAAKIALLEKESTKQQSEIVGLSDSILETRLAKAKDYKTVSKINKAEIGKSINRLILKHFFVDGMTYPEANHMSWENYYNATSQHYPGAANASYEEKLDFLKWLNTL